MRPISWPSREEWAVERRTLSTDQHPSTSHGIADYATTAEEIEALRRAVLNRRKAYPLL